MRAIPEGFIKWEFEESSVTVMCTGGRDYNDDKTVFEVLDKLNPKLVFVGDASGADYLVRFWCQANKVKYRMFCANWDRYGRAAGPIRNKKMVRAKPDRCIAFPGGRGTADAKKQAGRAGIPILTVTYIEEE